MTLAILAGAIEALCEMGMALCMGLGVAVAIPFALLYLLLGGIRDALTNYVDRVSTTTYGGHPHVDQDAD